MNIVFIYDVTNSRTIGKNFGYLKIIIVINIKKQGLEISKFKTMYTFIDTSRCILELCWLFDNFFGFIIVSVV
jgi:hypothetical protein